jgi:micrococcal nuclease
MKTNVLRAALIAGLACAPLALGQATPAQAQDRRPSDLLELGTLAQVTQVIDGDTIEVTQNGRTFTVRYLGLDAPALEACHGQQARQANAALVQGKTVVIERDTTDVDEAGDALRYVYLVDGRMVNEDLLTAGQAVAVTRLSDASYQARLNTLAAEAQQARRGGWARCGWQAETPVSSPGNCLAVSVAELSQRIEKPSMLGALNPGDCVTINQAATAGVEAWSGEYIYHPAGSTVTLDQGFVRWKDGFVLMQTDPANAGQLLAHVSQYRPGNPRQVTFGGRTFTIPSREKVLFQAVLPLERDPGDASIVRLPVANTWVFKDLGDGHYQALVDFFQYASGDIRLPS